MVHNGTKLVEYLIPTLKVIDKFMVDFTFTDSLLNDGHWKATHGTSNGDDDLDIH